MKEELKSFSYNGADLEYVLQWLLEQRRKGIGPNSDELGIMHGLLSAVAQSKFIIKAWQEPLARLT